MRISALAQGGAGRQAIIADRLAWGEMRMDAMYAYIYIYIYTIYIYESFDRTSMMSPSCTFLVTVLTGPRPTTGQACSEPGEKVRLSDRQHGDRSLVSMSEPRPAPPEGHCQADGGDVKPVDVDEARRIGVPAGTYDSIVPSRARTGPATIEAGAVLSTVTAALPARQPWRRAIAMAGPMRR